MENVKGITNLPLISNIEEIFEDNNSNFEFASASSNSMEQEVCYLNCCCRIWNEEAHLVWYIWKIWKRICQLRCWGSPEWRSSRRSYTWQQCYQSDNESYVEVHDENLGSSLNEAVSNDTGVAKSYMIPTKPLVKSLMTNSIL